MADIQNGLMDEHEPRGEITVGKDGAYQPSDEEQKTIDMVKKLFEKAKAHRKKYDENWLNNYKFFRGKQWKEQRPSYRHSEVVNMVFQAIQSTVPIMTDARPRVEFVPKEPADTELANILNQVFESDWENGNWQQELLASIYDSHFYGHGIGSLMYDPKADFGAGAICHESADPFYFFPDPNALDVNRKCKFVVYAEPVDVECAKHDYPDKAKYIKPDLIDLVGGSKTELREAVYRSPVDARTLVEAGQGVDDSGKNQCLKLTAWIKSEEAVEERQVEANEAGEQVETYVSKLKYPNGRKVVVCGGVLCEDGQNPYEHGKFPYAKLINYMLPREFYGMSEVEQLEGPQRTFNKLVSFALDVLTLMGNPVWKVGTGANIDTENLINRPGLVIEADDITQVQREEGVQLQPYVLQLIDRMEHWFQSTSGNTEISQGINPSGVTTFGAITELKEAAQTRIRLKSRNMESYLCDIGKLWSQTAFQFYTAPRVFRITNNQNVNQYFKFHVDEGMNEQGEPVKVATYRPVNELGQEGEARQFILQGEFDVKINAGSSLPFAKSQRLQAAQMLFQAGAIDELELLKAADYPNYEEVYNRVQQRRAAMAQDQMAQQQQMAQADAQAKAQAKQPMPPAV